MTVGMYAETLKVLPVLAPADIAAAAAATQYVDLSKIVWGEIMVHFGAITDVSATVTLECSTAGSSNATEQAMGFNYRLSAAVATDTMGAITAGTSDGVAVLTGSDNTTLIIEIDPAAVAAKLADARYVRAVITPSSDNTVTIVGATFIGLPRYSGNSIPSAT